MMKEFVIGSVMIALFLCGFAITAGETGTERVVNFPSAFLVLFVVVGLCILFAAIMLKDSTPAARAAKVPGAGCGGILVMMALVVVIALFFVAGALVTLGGG